MAAPRGSGGAVASLGGAREGDAVRPDVIDVRGLVVRIRDRAVLDDVALTVRRGEAVAVQGRSGSGKTTLLHCLAGIRAPTAGEIRLGDDRMDRLNAARRAAVRLRHVGLVFQFAELLAELDVMENVTLPARMLGRGKTEAERAAGELLDRLGVAGKARSRVGSLSGGEAQRVAIARALVNEPLVVLADEPTGALDEDNAAKVGDLLLRTARETSAVVIATHDLSLAARADRCLRFRRGALVTP